MGASDLLLAVLALFLPPVVVLLKRGCSADLLINILLWCLGWVPGVLHAWYIIFKYAGGRSRSSRSSYVHEKPRSSRSSGHSSYYNAPLPAEYAPGPQRGYHAPPPGYH